jgi:hypothetical protein
MLRFPRLQVSFVLFLVWESSCHKKQVAVPLPSTPITTQPATPATATPAAAKSEAPTLAPSTTKTQEPAQYQVNKPPQPVPAVKKPTRPATVAPAPAPTPVTPAAPAPAAPAPKLGDILTPDEQKQYSASIDQSLSHAQTSLSSIGSRQLTKDQQAEAEQIRNFIQQAQDTRSSDPAGAKSLAERAEVLARDLAATFH